MARELNLPDIETAKLAAEMVRRLEVELGELEGRALGLRRAIRILYSAQTERWAQAHAEAMAALYPAESGAGSPSEASASAPAPDEPNLSSRREGEESPAVAESELASRRPEGPRKSEGEDR
jgi:hypothetical protein